MNSVQDHSNLPSFLLWLLSVFCSEEYYEEFRGDLEEIHDLRTRDRTGPGANFLIWIDTFSMLRIRFRRSRSTSLIFFPIGMFRNYLMVALRSLKRHAAFASINIFGLSVSMAVCLVLILFIRQNGTQDEFHEHADSIVRVYSDFKSASNRDNNLYGTSPATLASIMEQEIPGIEATTKVRSGLRGTLVYDGTGLPLDGLYAEPSFFDLFSFELKSGDPATALINPGSLVLTPSQVLKFFGDEDPMGKVMNVSGGREFTITGVLASDDYHTILPLSAIASYSTLEADEDTQIMLDTWTRSIYRSFTFALLSENASVDDIQSRVRELIPVHFAEQDNNKLHDLIVQPLTSINLGVPMGNEIGVALPAIAAWFLASLALMVLLTACFNYVGLTVSRSLKRSREVGVRKVFGASRAHISTQFVFETLVVSVVSVVLAVALLQWLEPAFNSMSFVSMTGIYLSIDYLQDGGLYLVLVVFAVFVALIAGFYPAMFLSRFQPADAVKGVTDSSGRGGSRLRKSLVVIQFSISLIFLIVTVSMMRQANHMQTADYGFAQKNIVNVRMFDVPYARFRDRVSMSSNIEMVSGISIIPAMGSRSDVWLSTPGMTDDEAIKGYQFSVDENFVENLELELLAGTNLTPEMEFDVARKALVNETTLRVLGLGAPMDAVGSTFIAGDSTVVEIAGVLKDFRADALTEKISANVFAYRAENFAWANVRVVPGRLEEAQEDIREAWSAMGHSRNVDQAVFETQLKNSFANLGVQDMYRLIGFIAMLAVLISCLGLLGIASFNVERRTREISIRKVLGADVRTVVGLLSKEFLILIGLATLVSVPVAWYLASSWLQMFEYRISLGPGTIAIGLFAVLSIAFTAIGSQTIRAALANPVDNLHDD